MKKLSVFIILILLGCGQQQYKQNYNNQIGDTKFNKEIDNPNFKLCEEKTLHSRSKITFEGGYKLFYKKLNDKFKNKHIESNFSGFVVIRFAVNCSNDIGRLRWEILDSNFKKSNCSKELEKHLIDCLRKIKGWKHPIIDGKDYDGYTFISIKYTNGKIIL